MQTILFTGANTGEKSNLTGSLNLFFFQEKVVHLFCFPHRLIGCFVLLVAVVGRHWLGIDQATFARIIL
jgi:hypothetical protein